MVNTYVDSNRLPCVCLLFTSFEPGAMIYESLSAVAIYDLYLRSHQRDDLPLACDRAITLHYNHQMVMNPYPPALRSLDRVASHLLSVCDRNSA